MKLWYHHGGSESLPPTSAKAGPNSCGATSEVSAVFQESAIRWGRTHEDDARTAYVQHLANNSHVDATVSRAGLVTSVDETCLACSPDGLVSIPGTAEPLRVVAFKCPYGLAHDLIALHRTPQCQSRHFAERLERAALLN